ncbi:Riboflavin biosynthesis protein RibD [Sesbania bispinosa]|nr:Riboflavin biosynthesis protein RibD [Sesbania bispinosa]
METNKMGNHAIVSTKMFMGTPSQGSSSTQHPHIAIPIDELTGAMEDAKETKNLTDSKDNDKKTEETGECRYCQEEETNFQTGNTLWLHWQLEGSAFPSGVTKREISLVNYANSSSD